MFSLIVGSQLPNTSSAPCVRSVMAHYLHRDVRHAEQEAKILQTTGQGAKHVSARQCKLRGDARACVVAIVDEEAERRAIEQGGNKDRYATGKKRRRCILSDCKQRKRRAARRANLFE